MAFFVRERIASASTRGGGNVDSPWARAAEFRPNPLTAWGRGRGRRRTTAGTATEVEAEAPEAEAVEERDRNLLLAGKCNSLNTAVLYCIYRDVDQGRNFTKKKPPMFLNS